MLEAAVKRLKTKISESWAAEAKSGTGEKTHRVTNRVKIKNWATIIAGDSSCRNAEPLC